MFETVEQARAELLKLWRGGQKDEAQVLFHKLRDEGSSSDQMALVASEFAFFQLKDQDAGIALSEEGAARHLDAKLLRSAARLNLIAGRVDETEALAARYIDNASLRGSALSILGCTTLKVTRSLQLAAVLFNRAAEHGGIEDDNTAAMSHAITEDAFAGCERLHTLMPPNTIEIADAHALTGAKWVVMMACDEAYFDAFSEAFVVSLKHQAKGRMFPHIHLVDVDDARWDQISASRKTVDSPFYGCGLSRETTGHRNKGYYYAARFMALPRLLEHYKLPILTTDADCIFLKSLDPVEKTVADADFGVTFMEHYLYPWANYRAGMFFTGSRDVAHILARCMAGFLNSMPQDRTNYFYLDQLALVEAYFMAQWYGMVPVSLGALVNSVTGQPSGGSLADKKLRADEILLRSAMVTLR